MEIGGSVAFTDDIIAEPFVAKRGMAQFPERPGLVAEVNNGGE
jgi:L-alanine-DL-glutamate epimerase-like enolase superfamily enzyme